MMAMPCKLHQSMASRCKEISAGIQGFMGIRNPSSECVRCTYHSWKLLEIKFCMKVKVSQRHVSLLFLYI